MGYNNFQIFTRYWGWEVKQTVGDRSSGERPKEESHHLGNLSLQMDFNARETGEIMKEVSIFRRHRCPRSTQGNEMGSKGDAEVMASVLGGQFREDDIL